MDKEIESVMEVREFIALNSIEIDSFGTAKFDANITYSWGGKIVDGISIIKVTLNGFECGKISITETEGFSSDIMHLDFTKKYQTYSYDKSSNQLTIQGNSNKMSGDYTVVIRKV